MLAPHEHVNRFHARNEAVITEALRTYIAVQQLSGDPQAQTNIENAGYILLAHSLCCAETTVDLTMQ